VQEGQLGSSSASKVKAKGHNPDMSHSLVEAATERTAGYVSRIEERVESTVTSTALQLPADVIEVKQEGKVRDVYRCKDFIVMVATDRQSAFDRQLASVPFKGQVLNQTSLWWFEQTKHLVPNHVIASPHANITIGKKCSVFPVEFVMRGYITGSTSTSIWTNYNAGVRQYCGHTLPEGLVKNQKLEQNLLTPTTKDDVHDELISAEEIVTSGRMTQADFDLCARYSHSLFAFSQQLAQQRGLILVDTKYEFGKTADGQILLIDEIQTPDSSRFWVAESYQERLDASPPQEPENIDKEFLRRWYADRCDPYKDAVLPEAPRELVCELSRRYIMIYEIMTGGSFAFADSSADSMNAALEEYLQKKQQS
jgi:phosphoribosylaminoimidazole-succinocarboxamide synthase